jgi:hemolysin-activating ACP:hemolysin acyltransferase
LVTSAVTVTSVTVTFGGHEAMLQDLKANVFAEREISYLWNEDGKGVVKSV